MGWSHVYLLNGTYADLLVTYLNMKTKKNHSLNTCWIIILEVKTNEIDYQDNWNKLNTEIEYFWLLFECRQTF